jgi:ribonuclease P protein component
MCPRAKLQLRRSLRLGRSAEFERVLKHGKRGGDRRLRVWALPNDLEHSRFGLIVGRRHGSAVRRNRIKRILREAFRLSQAELPKGLDIACTPRVGVEMELQGTIRSLVEVTKRLGCAFGSGCA